MSKPSHGQRLQSDLAPVLGTTSGQLASSDMFNSRPGVFGVVDGGLLAGDYSHAAGQAAVGDMFDWWLKSIAGAGHRDAESVRKEWESEPWRPDRGVVALDWLNGSRSPRVDPLARGVLAGLSLATTPADVYHGLVTAAACGARQIVEFLEGIVGEIDRIRVTGGLADVGFVVKRYADVLNRPLEVAVGLSASAVGAAVDEATAAGLHASSEPTLDVVQPNGLHGDEVYQQYRSLQRRIRDETSGDALQASESGVAST